MVRRKQIVGLSHSNKLIIASAFVLVSILCSTSAAQKSSSISDKNSRRRAEPAPPTVTKPPQLKPQKPAAKTSTTRKTVKPTTSGPSITTEDCDKVRKQYINLGFPIDNALKSPMPGSSQSVCGSSYTCCSRPMEQRLYQDIARKVQHDFRSRLRKNYAKLEEQEAKLKSYMHKLLNTSYNQLHKMFIRTYGFHYNQNSGVFVAFYKRMHEYLDGRVSNVGNIVNDFFKEMCSRMIKMLHMKNMMRPNTMQYRPVRPHLLKCLSQHFYKMDPYKGVPKGIRKDLIRSLTAGRTLAMTLRVQREVLARLLTKYSLAPECLNALTRVQHCAMCSAELSAKPCPNFCENVIRGCYAHIFMITVDWAELSHAVVKLVNLLEGRNSLEHIFENSLSVKISEAITNFQGKFEKHKQTLYSKCQTPYSSSGVSRRSMAMMSKQRSRRSIGRYPQRRRQSLKMLLSVLKSQVLRPQKMLPLTLVNSLCKKVPFQSSSDDRRCWNGTAVGPYEGELVQTTFRGQVSNPEVAVDVSRLPRVMMSIISLVRIARERIKSAVEEKEVQVVHFPPTSVHGSGRRTLPLLEGSGAKPLPVEAGSGVNPPVISSKPKQVERPPEDDEVVPVKVQPPLFNGPEGSGSKLLEGSGALRETRVKVVKVSTTAPPRKPRLRPSTTSSTTSTTTTTTTTKTPEMKKPRPPIDDVEGSGGQEMTKPEKKLPDRKLPERKAEEKTKKKTKQPLPVDEEDTGSGDGGNFGNSGRRWPVPRTDHTDVEGSGAGSGLGPTREEQTEQEPGPGYNIQKGGQFPENDGTYPRTLWIPKAVKVVDDPDGGYRVRPDAPVKNGPSAQSNTKECGAPKCTGIVPTPLNNLLLLLTVALLSAALLV